MAMLNSSVPVAAQTPAANTPAVLTLTAPTNGTCWTLTELRFSYSAAPTGGLLTIAWTDPVAGAVSELHDVIAGGANQFRFPNEGKVFPANTLVTITLAAGGAGIFGRLYATAKTMN